MSLLNYLKKETEQEGVISQQELAKLDMKRFEVCEASSLNSIQKESADGTYIIQKTPQKEKYFIKKEGQWYSITTTVDYPNGVCRKQLEEVE